MEKKGILKPSHAAILMKEVNEDSISAKKQYRKNLKLVIVMCLFSLKYYFYFFLI